MAKAEKIWLGWFPGLKCVLSVKYVTPVLATLLKATNGSSTSLFSSPLGDLFLRCVDFFILVTKNRSPFNKTLQKVPN